MIDLSTEYMGLRCRNPIFVGSCGLTNSVSSIKRLEEHGAGGVVLKSIFEEQIMQEAAAATSEHISHSEEAAYINQYTRQHDLDEYLKLIQTAKEETSIPIIASINCVSNNEWVAYAKTIESAGADALELNVFVLPADFRNQGSDIERIYFDVLENVNARISIPLSIKIGYYFSGLANMLFELSLRDLSGMVLFNRFYSPDVDLQQEAIVAGDVLSNPAENRLILRWVGLLSNVLKCDLAASTGIHDGDAALKNILAGAKVVQVASCLYTNGPEHIGRMLQQMAEWMERHGHSSIRAITGKLSHEKVDNPLLYERAQFMKYYSSRD